MFILFIFIYFKKAIGHEGSKASRAIFLRCGLIFTTGFSKMSERQYSLRSPEHLSEPIVNIELDTSNGVMFPLYDADTNLVYLCGKVRIIISVYRIALQMPPLFLLFDRICYLFF